MQETTTQVTAMEMEEERYVKVGTRFYRVAMRPTGAGDGDGAVARHRRLLHYLESCYLCKESIAYDRDVFMYKGDAAFCSEDCRDEQMDMDEALLAAARRHQSLHLLRSPPAAASSSHSQQAAAPVMRRRPTIANLAARNPPAVPAT